MPTLIFINKMDQPVKSRRELMKEIRARLGNGCVDYTAPKSRETMEDTAVLEERVLEHYLEEGDVPEEAACSLVSKRLLFPCFFGSALKGEGIGQLLYAIRHYLAVPPALDGFGARVYKIARDGQGARLAFLKVTGGVLHVKDMVPYPDGQEEKVDQIRLYNGARYELVQEAEAGTVCAVTGLSLAQPGMGLGAQENTGSPLLEPAMSYELIIPPEVDRGTFRHSLEMLQEEEPLLQMSFDPQNGQVFVHLMGEVETQILQSLIRSRFGVQVEFGPGKIQYKETILDRVEGVGHYEPLRHYAEVHLLLEPGEPGSGVVFQSDCPKDVLAANWQSQVRSCLEGHPLIGTAIGAPLTDIRITMVSGRASEKHTEGGDFREAALRALRQGLMQARPRILEPWYQFRILLPKERVGRAMADLENRGASFAPPQMEGGRTFLTGSAPAKEMQGYQRTFSSYAGGEGELSLMPGGYLPCHDEQQVLQESPYDPERDMENPSGSIFCVHGAGVYVPWDKVKEKMHLPSFLKMRGNVQAAGRQSGNASKAPRGREVGEEELMAIFRHAHMSANRKEKPRGREKPCGKSHSGQQENRRYGENKDVREEAGQAAGKTGKAGKTGRPRPQDAEEDVLLVDGYNLIYSQDHLREMALENMDAARGMLNDILCNVQGYYGMETVAVYDAYHVPDQDTEVLRFRNIHIVFTKEAETADQYIDKTAIALRGKRNVLVATSDKVEQVIAAGQDARILPAERFFQLVEDMGKEIHAKYLGNRKEEKRYLFDGVDEKVAQELGLLHQNEEEKHGKQEKKGQ